MKIVSFAFLLAASTPLLAHATDYEAEGGTEKAYRHGGQFKLYAQVGDSYRLIFRYNKDVYCGESEKDFCKGWTPAWLELGAGYGVTDAFEILTDVRLGLGSDIAPANGIEKGPKVLAIQPGIRVFIDDAGSIKFFTTFQASFDLTSYSKDVNAKSLDFGLRNVNGLLIDFHRTFGIYIHVGDTFGFVRWFRFEIDGGIGLMVRFP
jgi:hypothetical protein